MQSFLKLIFYCSFFPLLIVSGCNEEECEGSMTVDTYSLDVSNMTYKEQNNYTVQAALRTYNPSMMAIFPVDLSSSNKTAATISADNIFLVQTKSTCGEENGRLELPENHDIVQQIDDNELIFAQKNVAHIVSINVEMPYVSKSYQGRSWIDKPEKLAVAFHIKDKGWVIHNNCVESRLDDALQIGFVEVSVNETNVDAIGILFHTMTYVNKISYQVQKTCEE